LKGIRRHQSAEALGSIQRFAFAVVEYRLFVFGHRNETTSFREIYINISTARDGNNKQTLEMGPMDVQYKKQAILHFSPLQKLIKSKWAVAELLPKMTSLVL
jgi:hypothetical protein